LRDKNKTRRKRRYDYEYYQFFQDCLQIILKGKRGIQFFF
jgi:hypothetical protein